MKKSDYIRIELDRRRVAFGLLLAVFGVLASEALSESVSVTTYYPAPIGVYRNLRATHNAVLAYDKGAVGIGTEAPQAPLHIAVDAKFNGALDVGENAVLWGDLNIAGSLSATESLMDVQGLQLGSGGACNSGDEGTLDYDGTGIRFCDGSDWQGLGM